MKTLLTLLFFAFAVGICRPLDAVTVSDMKIQKIDGYNLLIQDGGPSLGYSQSSGVKIIYADGLAFKDLNRSGRLEPYEDWRLPAAERARDLASRLSVEEIAGLMLYSSHQAVPASRDLATIEAEGVEKDSILSNLSFLIIN